MFLWFGDLLELIYNFWFWLHQTPKYSWYCRIFSSIACTSVHQSFCIISKDDFFSYLIERKTNYNLFTYCLVLFPIMHRQFKVNRFKIFLTFNYLDLNSFTSVLLSASITIRMTELIVFLTINTPMTNFVTYSSMLRVFLRQSPHLQIIWVSK